jgi:hypothetical protein
MKKNNPSKHQSPPDITKTHPKRCNFKIHVIYKKETRLLELLFSIKAFEFLVLYIKQNILKVI